MLQPRPSIVAAAATLALAVATVTGPVAFGQSSAPDPLDTPSLDGSFAVSDGRNLAIRCWGEGEPAIVLVGGHPSMGIADFEGQPFLGPLAERTRVCAYARSGYPGSDPAPNEPRDADDLDRDLHELLAAAGIDGPLVMVGGSFGGFIVSYYAAKHPEDVMGVVMLDVPAPSATLTVSDAPEIAWDHPANPEHTDTVAEFENRFAAKRLPIQAPLTVITATDGQSTVSDQAIWLEISPAATQVELEGGHGIAVDDPSGVAAAILKMVDAVGRPLSTPLVGE